jgi:PadR family transcriptional regulator, regulatory protein PadR
VTSKIEPSQDGPPRKYFELTPQGEEAITGMNNHWDKLIASIENIRKNM